MVRVVAVIGGALMLSACSSTPDWLSVDFLKPGPVMDTVRFESEPPGAEVKTSTGGTCRTPCALAIEAANPVTATFTLPGYVPATENLEVVSGADGARLRPNPVTAELVAAPPPARRPAPAARKKPPAPRAAARPAPAPSADAPPPPAASSPWPSR